MISPETIAGIKALMAEASVFEDDLDESFVLGGGPGGQKTNKTSNVVRLSHEPSGLSVRCGETRSRETNRWLARRLLAETILEREHKRVSAEQQRREKVRRQKRRRSRRQKQKMLDDKHAHSAIKALRRKVDLMTALAAASTVLLCLFAPCAAAVDIAAAFTNSAVTMSFDPLGRVSSLREKASGRELVAKAVPFVDGATALSRRAETQSNNNSSPCHPRRLL